MDSEISNTIKAIDKEAQYDQNAKKLLGHKIFLAHILAKTVGEFKGMDPKEIVQYIEGDPIIGKVPVDPGFTNISRNKIVGFNTEDSQTYEGLVRFDIIFYVRMKDGLSQIIINVEAQKDEPKKYDILNRAILYAARLVSSQKDRDFLNTDYNNIKQVYTIWICMNENENCMNHIHLTNDKLLGNHEWKGNIDIINIVLIGISSILPEYDDDYELHRLLGVLLSKDLTAIEKLDILETEFDIPAKQEIREEINIMCNLSQGIREQTAKEVTKIVTAKVTEEVTAKVTEEVTAKVTEEVTEEVTDRFIMRMYAAGDSVEKIAEISEKNVEEVEAILEKQILN